MSYRDDTAERNKERATPVRINELDVIFESMSSAATFLGATTGQLRDALRGYKMRTDRRSGRTAYTSVLGFTVSYASPSSYESQLISVVQFINNIKNYARGRRLFINDNLLDILQTSRREFWAYMVNRAVVEHADLQMLNKDGAISVEWKVGRLAA